MPNIMKLMKQAADMQRNMAKAQEELAEREVEFASGGGAVSIKASGDGNIRSVRISPDVVKEGEAEMLEDLVLSAIIGVQEEAKKVAQEVMGKVTAGMNLPPGLGF
jgi:hypothetical protein